MLAIDKHVLGDQTTSLKRVDKTLLDIWAFWEAAANKDMGYIALIYVAFIGSVTFHLATDILLVKAFNYIWSRVIWY